MIDYSVHIDRKQNEKRNTILKEALITAMGNAVDEVRNWPQKEAQIFHHNDSDGLTSGAILTTAFERAGFKIQRSCLEKPYPKLLHKIYEQTGGLIIFADFAGRIAPRFKPQPQSHLDPGPPCGRSFHRPHGAQPGSGFIRAQRRPGHIRFHHLLSFCQGTGPCQ